MDELTSADDLLPSGALGDQIRGVVGTLDNSTVDDLVPRETACRPLRSSSAGIALRPLRTLRSYRPLSARRTLITSLTLLPGSSVLRKQLPDGFVLSGGRRARGRAAAEDTSTTRLLTRDPNHTVIADEVADRVVRRTGTDAAPPVAAPDDARSGIALVVLRARGP